MATTSVQSTLRSLFVSTFLCWVLFSPASARAEADSLVALGLGVHGTMHLSDAYNAGEGLGGGAQLRLKLLRVIGVRMDYDFGRMVDNPVSTATRPSDLVPYPDLRFAAGIHFFPNKYLSPHIAAGMGVNTKVGFSVPVLLVGAGLETTIKDHWVIGFTGQVYYPTPNRVSKFISDQIAVGKMNWSAKDFLVPAAYQFGLELSYYL
jgi:hypothetical protein